MYFPIGDAAIELDPVTLKIISSRGWSASDIEATREGLDELIAGHNGERSSDTWQLPHPSLRHRDDMHIDPTADGHGLTATQQHMLRDAVAQQRGWQVTAAQRQGKKLLVAVRHPGGEAVLSLHQNNTDQRCYREIDGVRCSYRVVQGDSPAEQTEQLDAVLEKLATHGSLST